MPGAGNGCNSVNRFSHRHTSPIDLNMRRSNRAHRQRVQAAIVIMSRVLDRGFVLGLVCMLATGCSAATWQGVADGLATSAPVNRTTKLMLFGGPGHDTYLGCINCNEYSTDSVFNEYGPHGSRYSANSILNPYSQFGSRYSTFGACNTYASDPPVIVDRDGRFYGRLTLNQYHRQATRDGRLLAWLAGVCAD